MRYIYDGYAGSYRGVYVGGSPSSRPTLTTTTRLMTYAGVSEVETDVPVPDLFRMESPFVERNFRLDYSATNHLHEPLADESRLRAELSYSFTERLGIIVEAPYIFLNNFDGPSTSGFGDLEVGARFVAIGSEKTAPFKLAIGVNVTSPTGDSDRDLGEGLTFIEPELLVFQRLGDRSFAVGQLGLEIPLNGDDTANELRYNLGIGHVFVDVKPSRLFSTPTPIFEINCLSAIDGEESGRTVVDLTSGLRWQLGSGWAGVAFSFPVSRSRESESQFIFSLVYPLGSEPEQATSSSRPVLR